MNVNWWWVRHGPTHAKTLIGHTDLPADLSDIAALERLKNFLPTDAKLISSDLIRATATADAIINQQNRHPHAVALREMHFGDWEGLGFDAVAEKDAALSREFWEFPGDATPPNGESWNVFSARIHKEIHKISANNGAGNIIAVAHFGVILAAVQLAANIPAKSVFSFKVDNLSVTRLSFDIDAKSWTVKTVNQNI